MLDLKYFFWQTYLNNLSKLSNCGKMNNPIQVEQREPKQFGFVTMSPPEKTYDGMIKMDLELRVPETWPLQHNDKPVVYVEKRENRKELIHYDEKNMTENKKYFVEWYDSKVYLVKTDDEIILKEL